MVKNDWLYVLTLNYKMLPKSFYFTLEQFNLGIKKKQ
jgi:hypothetical protein